jgi:heavy metal efflux system protein
VNGIVAFAVKQPVFILALFILLLGAGVIAFLHLDIEAYPDMLPPYVEVTTVNPGQSAEDTERYVTIPLEIQLSGLPHVTSVDSRSVFGLSDIVVRFTYAFTYDEARQWVLNRLSQIGPLPNGAEPSISEDSPIGQIYRYRVVGPPGYDLTDLKEIADWVLKPLFKAVPGVAGVSDWGGKTKAYTVRLDEDRLVKDGLGVPQVAKALKSSNSDVGGQLVDFGPQAAVVRGVGLIHTLAQIEDTLVSTNHGAPIRVGDIARVRVGHLPRLGVAGQDSDGDIVLATVLMRRGEKALPVVLRVEAEVRTINHSGILPPGVHLEKIYDFRQLIEITTATVLHNLILGLVLIFFVQWLFLGDLKSAVVVAATIPFALLFAVSILVMRGESANLLSVGAIDFGLIVNATVIMVENIFRHLRRSEAAASHVPAADARAAGLRGKALTIYRAALEVNQPVLFSAAIIIAGFVPLFTLSGVEGHIFGPMARTYGYAILGGLLATFTVSPVLSALLLPDRIDDIETLVARTSRRLYRPLLQWALANRVATLGGLAVLGLAAILAARSLGLTYLPTLEEGNLWIRATMPASVSLKEAKPYVDRIRRIVGSFSEVETVTSQDGRPDSGTDAIGPFLAKFYVALKPARQWRTGVDKRKLVHEIDGALEAQLPGIDFSFSQYISNNIDEVLTGTKSANAVKIFGHHLATLERLGHEIENVMAGVRGITDLSVPRALGQPTIEIRIDRRRAARYGLTPDAINDTVEAAIGGKSAGRLYERGSDRNFPIIVRLAARYRGSLAQMRRIMVMAAAPGGGTIEIPLADLASVKLVSGPSFIYRQDQERYVPVMFSVRGRPLASAVFAAQRAIAQRVRLPSGYRLEWLGQFSELKSAIERLAIIVPLSLALIGLLLFVHFERLSDALIAATAMPMAWIGGILALFLTGTPFSVSAAIGFVGLFGVSVMESIIILSYFNALVEDGGERMAAILRACDIRLRPVLMTCFAAAFGLLPAALSTSIGSQVQRPLALVIVGGTLLAPALILLVLPVLIDLFSRREARVAARAPQPAPGE